MYCINNRNKILGARKLGSRKLCTENPQELDFVQELSFLSKPLSECFRIIANHVGSPTSGMCNYIAGYVFSRCFEGKYLLYLQGFFVEFEPLKTKATLVFRRSGITYPLTQWHFPVDGDLLLLLLLLFWCVYSI